MNHLQWQDQKKVLEEMLLKGKESATQLQTLIKKPLLMEIDNGSFSADELSIQILTSFTDTLSMLQLNQIVSPADGLTRSNSSDLSSKITDKGGRLRKKPAGVKDRRGFYKRRNVSGTQTKTSSTMEDEHAWRKYGQKEILRSKFPRCYFRCTYKNDQGCKAKKQVQMIQENPTLYQTTYFGHHTCNDKPIIMSAPPPQIIIQELSDIPMDSNCLLLSFETKMATNDENLKPSSELTGHNEEVVSGVTTMHGNFDDMEEVFSKFDNLDTSNLYYYQDSDFFNQLANLCK